MIRILIIDDFPVVQEGLVAIFEHQPDCEVVGVAASPEDAFSLVTTESPDVILLDLESTRRGGIEAIAKIDRARPATNILVLTGNDDDERILSALKAGAKGYLLKGEVSNDGIIQAVRMASLGGVVLSSNAASRMLQEVEAARRADRQLTDLETTILKQVADGWPNKQIAYALGMSERTVKFRMTAIFKKLHAENRAQAVAMAAQQGLLESTVRR